MTEVDTKTLTEEWRTLRAELRALDDEWWGVQSGSVRNAKILVREAEVQARIAEIDALLPPASSKYTVRYVQSQLVDFEVESMEDWRVVEQQLATGALTIQPSAIVGSNPPHETYRLIGSEVVR